MYPCHPHFADGTLVVRASHWETQTDRLRVNHLHCSRAWESSYGSDSTDLRHRGLLKPWLLLVTISSRWFFKLGASNTVTPGGRAFRPSLKTVTDEACPLQQWSASLVAKALALQTKFAHWSHNLLSLLRRSRPLSACPRPNEWAPSPSCCSLSKACSSSATPKQTWSFSSSIFFHLHKCDTSFRTNWKWVPAWSWWAVRFLPCLASGRLGCVI